MKRIRKLLILTVFLLRFLVLSGCNKKGDDSQSDNTGLSHNNSRGEPWPNVLIWYKTDRRVIDSGDSLSVIISFSNHAMYKNPPIVPAKLLLHRQAYNGNNSFELIETILLKEIANFSEDYYHKDVFTSNENTMEVNILNEWFIENAGNFKFELCLFPENALDNISYGYTLILYYRKIDDKIYFYTSKYNYENDINK